MAKTRDLASGPIVFPKEGYVPPEILTVFDSGVRGQETVRLDLQFPGVECTAEEDMARQEYLLSTDLAAQFQRLGMGMPRSYGEVDLDLMDATTAFELIQDAQAAWERLPKVVRDRYHSWAAIETAERSGELAQLLKVSGTGAAVAPVPEASPSDSAAEGSSAAS